MLGVPDGPRLAQQGDGRGPVDPPARYSINERAAFLLGVEAAGLEMHEEMLRIEGEAEMASIGMAY